MIERMETGQRMSQIVKHNGVAYLAGQIGEGDSVADQTRDCLARVDARQAIPRLISHAVAFADLAGQVSHAVMLDDLAHPLAGFHTFDHGRLFLVWFRPSWPTAFRRAGEQERPARTRRIYAAENGKPGG